MLVARSFLRCIQYPASSFSLYSSSPAGSTCRSAASVGARGAAGGGTRRRCPGGRRGGELRLGGRALLEQVPGALGECVLIGADGDRAERRGDGRRHQPPARPMWRRPPSQSGCSDRAGLEEKHQET
jgi:hypothetical protein